MSKFLSSLGYVLGVFIIYCISKWTCANIQKNNIKNTDRVYGYTSQSDIEKHIGISDTETCFINTLQFKQSQGINMNIYRRCKLKPYYEDGASPDILKQFSTDTEDSIIIAQSISMYTPQKSLTPDVIDLMQQDWFIKSSCEIDSSEYILSKKMTIKKVSLNEILSIKKIKRERYNIKGIANYEIFYKKSVVNISFFVIGSNYDVVRTVLFNDVPSFRELIERTDFLN